MRRGARLKKSKCLSSLPRKIFRKSRLPTPPRCYKSFEKTFLKRRPMWVTRLPLLPEWQSHFQLACTSGTKVSNNKDSPGSKPSSYPRLNGLQFNIIFARFFCSTGRVPWLCLEFVDPPVLKNVEAIAYRNCYVCLHTPERERSRRWSRGFLFHRFLHVAEEETTPRQ